ncbi:MAG: protein kinase [Nannocystaceae bacterium]
MHSRQGDDELGQVLDGRFKILERIGSGGMGSVFLCEDLALRSRAAVKILGSRDPDARRRFFDEAALLANLSHPNLVQVRAIGETEDGAPYMAMEYLGESLSARLRDGGALPWREAVDIVDQIAGALSVLHAAGVVHRDIKPGNIVQIRGVTGRTLVKLIDLGVARVEDWTFVQSGGPKLSPRRATREGSVVGTPGFVPPEAGECRPDQRFDVFGLGVTLYKLCTGMMPDRGRPRAMREVRPDLEIPADLDAVVAQAMAEAPARTASAAAFARDLEAICTAHASSGPQESILFDECYEIVELLGVGAKAEVYRAYHRDRRRYVALKLLREELLEDAEERRRLDREARVLSALSHPAIPVLLDCRTGATRRRPFIAMELRSGRRVGDFWPERLEPAEVIAVGRQLAEALVEMGARGVVHRDLSRANVLVDLDTRRGGRPIASIIDLGQAELQDMFWAKVDERYPTPPEARTRLGTGGLERLEWTAPEARAGEGWTGRSDVYSLGLLLYLLLTGKRPAKDEDGKWISPEELVPECPGALVDAIRASLQEDPARRLDAAGLCEYLDEAAAEVREMELAEVSATSGARAASASSAVPDPGPRAEAPMSPGTGARRPLLAGVAVALVVALAWTLGYGMGAGLDETERATPTSTGPALTASAPLVAGELVDVQSKTDRAPEVAPGEAPALDPAGVPEAAPDVEPEATPAAVPARPRRLSSSAFQRSMEGRRVNLELCARNLRDAPEIAVAVDVASDGSVAEVSVSPGSFLVQRCVEDALEGLRFSRAVAPSTHTWHLRRRT